MLCVKGITKVPLCVNSGTILILQICKKAHTLNHEVIRRWEPRVMEPVDEL